MEFPLTVDSKNREVYTADPFIPPKDFFYVKVRTSEGFERDLMSKHNFLQLR